MTTCQQCGAAFAPGAPPGWWHGRLLCALCLLRARVAAQGPTPPPAPPPVDPAALALLLLTQPPAPTAPPPVALARYQPPPQPPPDFDPADVFPAMLSMMGGLLGGLMMGLARGGGMHVMYADLSGRAARAPEAPPPQVDVTATVVDPGRHPRSTTAGLTEVVDAELVEPSGKH